jgi:DNA modification methylase
MIGLRLTNTIRVQTGNAIDLMDTLPSNSVDLIIADPPYNLGKDYGNNLDNIEFDEYIKFSKNWLSSANRIIKPTGTIYVFMGVRFISYLYDILERELNLSFNTWITWHYTQGIGKTKGFSPRHDDILMFTKSKKFTFNLDAIRVPQKYYRERNNMRGANPGDVWEFSHVHYCQDNRQPHPTQKPEGLIERMVLASSNEGDFVLDPFCGSGTTLRVCQQINRNSLGFELNPDYVQMTQERLSKPFYGFDGNDPRMERIPNDLNDEEIRKTYLKNHVKWFLQNHPDAIINFEKAVEKKYGGGKSSSQRSHSI